MDRRYFLVAIALIASTSIGCGSKSSAVGEGQQWVDSVPTPDVTLREFLEAVRTGDDAKAEQLLTVVAREETRKHDLSVAPPGSETAKFEVGKVEYIAANEVAHVESTWTDIGEDGQPQSDMIIWMLRRDPAGWRIAGMATKIFKDELPLLLDFEDPEDMIRPGGPAAGAAPTAQVPVGGGVSNPLNGPRPTNAEKPGQRNVLRQ
jgi:hypothetical protein